MTSLAIDAAVTRLTQAQASAASDSALSSILLIISVVAIGAAGVGLILMCARALVAKSATKGWVYEAVLPLDDPGGTLPPNRATASYAPFGGAPPIAPPGPTLPGSLSRFDPTREMNETALTHLVSQTSETDIDAPEPETRRASDPRLSPVPPPPVPPVPPSFPTIVSAPSAGYRPEPEAPVVIVGYHPPTLISTRTEALPAVETTLRMPATPQPTFRRAVVQAPPAAPTKVTPADPLASTQESAAIAAKAGPTLTPSSSGLVAVQGAVQQGARDLENFQYGARRA
jgi:hypothetical protein